MKVEIESKNLIKPSFSTPSILRRYKISFIDEFAPKMYVPLVLFFPLSNGDVSRSIAKLRKSLEKTLTLMYPLAGRYIEDIREVDCNDQGVEFIQAQVDITFEEIRNLKVDPKVNNEFLPLKIWSTFETTNPLLLAIQVTIFRCGGLALGVNMSHKIGDAATLTTFLTQWATLSRRETKVETVANSIFPMSRLFPSRGLSPFKVNLTNSESNDDYVRIIKLSFNANAISNMRAKATLGGKMNTRHMSKGQLVSALLWKAFIGVDYAIYGHPECSALVQPIDLRHETISLIPKNAFGNLWGLIVTSCDTIKEFEELTALLADNFKNIIEEYSKVGHDNHEMIKMILNSFSHFTNIPNSTELIWITSWCKFPFYGVNFGFGKPVWKSFGFGPFKRGIILLDDEGGDGVEAYVNLGVKHVPYFEQDEDIKAFASGKQRTRL